MKDQSEENKESEKDKSSVKENESAKNKEPGSESLTPMMQQYTAIKEKHPDCLLFYRLGDFFELFLEDAVIASKELDIALTKRGKQGHGADIPMCGVPAHAYELYLAKLIQKGYRVVICDQIETPEEAKLRGAKGPLARDITRIVTRGTLIEDELLPLGNNYLITLSPLPRNAQTVSLAIADISTGFFGLETFPLADLASHLARWNPSEIVLSSDLFQHASFEALLESWKKILVFLPKSRFQESNARYLLQSVYNVQTLDVFGSLKESEIQAAGVLVDYVLTTQCCQQLPLSPPRRLEAQDFLFMDEATRRNLELMPDAATSRKPSLFSALNKTITAAGRRLFLENLATPLLDSAKINKRLDDIDFFIQNPALRASVRDLLKGLPDMERILSRLVLGRLSPKDLGALRVALEKSEHLASTLAPFEGAAAWHRVLDESTALLPELQRALKEDLPLWARDGQFIADGFDATLDDLRHTKDYAAENLKQLQDHYIQQTGIVNLKIRHNNIWGIYIEVSAAQTAKVPYTFIHKQTLVNGTRYTTAELSELEKHIEEAESKALKHERALFDELVKNVLAERELLLARASTLARLDVAAAGAHLAVENHYVRPQFETEPILDIVAGRHPVVEQAFSVTESSFSANDCALNPEKRRFLLLTGPNMAGKSTYLRQNALIIIMAQMGLYVPAQKATLGLVDRIFSRIGASDDLASGRSTFMVEMIETAAILHQATPRSFVILDEIGRGTATYDGLAIAWAVSEYLYQKPQCRTLFATHFHELTHLAELFEAIVPVTAATREWEDKIIFLHKIIDGFAQKSYGIHIAQLAGLPKSVIHRATELLQSFEKQERNDLFAGLPKPKEKSAEKKETKLQQEMF
ncbi:DNA mismatch repair protein MutS [Alphaproteobacteria bacterium]|nr:DNA mismatch repair protein MutS [Alphaproteobacteria bacterium]GHS98695.1 DNA mismatch repair protein MutS [Alphaproteobacteria bacterium]